MHTSTVFGKSSRGPIFTYASKRGEDGCFLQPPYCIYCHLPVEIQMMITSQNPFKVVRRVGSLSNHDDKAD